MFMLRRRAVGCLAVGAIFIAPFVSAQEAHQVEREAMYYRYLEFPSLVEGGWLFDL